MASISLRVKIRPAGIAFAAYVSLPIRDSRVHFVHLENWCNSLLDGLLHSVYLNPEKCDCGGGWCALLLLCGYTKLTA